MAILDKLFTKRKLEDDSVSRDCERSLPLNREQVRLLLFKECDWRGRKILFDSSTIERVPAGKDDKPKAKVSGEGPYIVEVSDGFSYVYKGPATDSNLLGEMIFGAVAMSYKGVSLKIHIMDEPRRLMFTKVFCLPSSRASRVDKKASDVSSDSSLSKPLNVPSPNEGVSLSFSLGRGDSGFCGESPQSSIGSSSDFYTIFNSSDKRNSTQDDLYFYNSPTGRKLSSSSNSSWQRRTLRSVATRFDLSSAGQSSNLLNVPTASSNVSNDSQIYSNSSASGTCDSLSTASSCVSSRRNKLGLGLLITVTDASEMDVVRKCLEHSSQLQSLVCRLRIAVLAAGTGARFMATLHKATMDATKWLSDLLYGPRIPPTWLNLVTSDPQRKSNKMAELLLTDLCSVLSASDTKNTNFFFSTLLTHVLTYHLGWVTTVSPYETLDPQKLDTDQKEHRRPYNALWAQLSDLCGSIGCPPRAAKTVICGTTNTQIINRILIVLAYFLRCGDVKKSDFDFQDLVVNESKVISVNNEENTLNKTSNTSTLPEISNCIKSTNTQDSGSSVSTLVPSQISFKRSTTLANLSDELSLSSDDYSRNIGCKSDTSFGTMKRNPTMLLPVNMLDSSDSSSVSEESLVKEEKVVFVLGDDEKLVGLKNKSSGGKAVKKSSKIHNEPVILESEDKEASAIETSTIESSEININKDIKNNDTETNIEDKHSRSMESPSKCCSQTLQHSKPIKHSGFKFEFDKYPQIVTNYMKSKNLEILDRHYIGKPGNLKLDNFQFDPTIVPPIQEEKCEICYKCQLMESSLQTPTNASELEYMNDIPLQSNVQYAKETLIEDDSAPQITPKTFTRKQKEDTIIVNVPKTEEVMSNVLVKISAPEVKRCERLKEIELQKAKDSKEKKDLVDVKQIVEFPLSKVCLRSRPGVHWSGFDASLLGGVTDHYVPDLVLQGTVAKPELWERDLLRDLDLTSYLNKSLESPIQAIAIVGDTNTWEVRVVGVQCSAGGMSALVAAMLDALPVMWRAKVPAHQCLSFLENKLREFCVLSKTLADMLMTTDFCDIATLTRSLNIDVNDVPLLLAVATTHTPQVTKRYGISYR